MCHCDWSEGVLSTVSLLTLSIRGVFPAALAGMPGAEATCMAKRKRPIAPSGVTVQGAAEETTAAPGSPSATGGGHHHRVEMEGEEIELRQETIPEASGRNPGGPSEPDTLRAATEISLPAASEFTEEDAAEFRREVAELQAERARRRKRAA